MTCSTHGEQFSDLLAAAADGSAIDDASVRRVVEHCLGCQAELAQYRRVLRALRALRTEILEPAPGLLGDILLSLEEAGERHALRSVLSGRRAAYLGGIAAAATAAAGAGALVLANRSRRSRVLVS